MAESSHILRSWYRSFQAGEAEEGEITNEVALALVRGCLSTTGLFESMIRVGGAGGGTGRGGNRVEHAREGRLIGGCPLEEGGGVAVIVMPPTSRNCFRSEDLSFALLVSFILPE